MSKFNNQRKQFYKKNIVNNEEKQINFQEKKCTRCPNLDHLIKDCPKRAIKCTKCYQFGHISQVCLNQPCNSCPDSHTKKNCPKMEQNCKNCTFGNPHLLKNCFNVTMFCTFCKKYGHFEKSCRAKAQCTRCEDCEPHAIINCENYCNICVNNTHPTALCYYRKCTNCPTANHTARNCPKLNDDNNCKRCNKSSDHTASECIVTLWCIYCKDNSKFPHTINDCKKVFCNLCKSFGHPDYLCKKPACAHCESRNHVLGECWHEFCKNCKTIGHATENCYSTYCNVCKEFHNKFCPVKAKYMVKPKHLTKPVETIEEPIETIEKPIIEPIIDNKEVGEQHIRMWANAVTNPTPKKKKVKTYSSYTKVVDHSSKKVKEKAVEIKQEIVKTVDVVIEPVRKIESSPSIDKSIELEIASDMAFLTDNSPVEKEKKQKLPKKVTVSKDKQSVANAFVAAFDIA